MTSKLRPKRLRCSTLPNRYSENESYTSLSISFTDHFYFDERRVGNISIERGSNIHRVALR